MTRSLDAAIRKSADAQGDRIADAIPTTGFRATVTSVVPGGAPDGNARVQVRWRGNVITVAGYASSYTPVVGHRVTCDFIDNQVSIAYRSIGG
jgi:hypothetical protein